MDSPYLFLHPGFSIVIILAHTEGKLKGHGRTSEKTKWIRLICFFIASLVESVALANPKKRKCLKGCGHIPLTFVLGSNYT